MKKNIVLTMTFILFLISVKETSAVEKSGELGKNEVWSGEIEIISGVIVPEHITLTIKPGTKIEYIKGWIKVRGKIIAEGTKAERILFTWKGEDNRGGTAIFFDETSDNSSVVKYTTISNFGCGIWVRGASPTISHNIIKDNHRGIRSVGLRADGSKTERPDSPLISYNTFIGNQFGIGCSMSSAIIKNNIITESIYEGLWCEGLPSPIIEGNIISRNGRIGILCASSSPLIIYNTIYGGKSGIRVGSGCSVRADRCVGMIAAPIITSNIIAFYTDSGIFEGANVLPTVRYNDIYTDVVNPLLGKRVLYRIGNKRFFDIEEVNKLRKDNKGNISKDPKFADAEQDNFKLRPSSPCLRKGEDRKSMGATGSRMAVEVKEKIQTTWGRIKIIK